jgi:hypothetical protein
LRVPRCNTEGALTVPRSKSPAAETAPLHDLFDDPLEGPQQVIRVIALPSVAALAKLIRAGGFPKADLVLGKNRRRWKRSTIRKWVEAQKTGGAA